jgi:hypothetical protein
LASSSTLLLLLFLKLKETSFTISSKTLNHIILCSVIAALILSISYYLIPDYFQFFSERLLNRSITPYRMVIFHFRNSVLTIRMFIINLNHLKGIVSS